MTTTLPGTHPFFGRIAVSHGVAFPLTPCCGASAKGLQDGVGCRSCYELIEEKYGMGWKADSPEFAKIREEMT